MPPKNANMQRITAICERHAGRLNYELCDAAMEKAAEDIYEKLQNAGVEVLLDDRKERPGVKFKDADLMGIPVAITAGRAAADGKVEFKLRRDAEKQELTIEEAVAKTIEIVNREKDGRHFFNK